MGHGTYRNVTHGAVHGAKHGGALTIGGAFPVAGVTLDALGNKHFPANATEWNLLLTAAGIGSGGSNLPSLLWNCQEVSGNLADSIGTFTGTASGATFTYQASTGYTRKGLTLAGTTATVANTDAGLPDLSTTSALVLTVEFTPSSAGSVRNHVQLTPTIASRAALSMNATSRILQESGATFGTGTINNGFSTVIPYALRVNRTSGQQTAFTALDKNTITIDAAVTGKALIAGGDSVIADPPGVQRLMYLVEWFGAAAEMTDAQIKTLLQTLGWSVSWT